MNYFTRKRYLALQERGEDAMDTADAAWDGAVGQYEAYLQTIRPELPEAIRELLDGFCLHDARVLSMGRRGDTFVVSLQLDVPPNELLTITYRLAGDPDIRQQLFPWATAGAAPAWLYDEIELVRDGDRGHFVHTILFSNGWEVRLPFREVHLATAYPTFPSPRTPHPVPPATAPSPHEARRSGGRGRGGVDKAPRSGEGGLGIPGRACQAAPGGGSVRFPHRGGGGGVER